MIARLVAVRRRLGLSQAAVAGQLVLDQQQPTKRPPQSFVSKCENRERRVDPVELAEFARVYRVTVADLLGESELPLGAAMAYDTGDLTGASLSLDAPGPAATPPVTPSAPKPRGRPRRRQG